MKKFLVFISVFVYFCTMPVQAWAGYISDEPEIKIYAEEMELKSQLKKRYSAYYVTIENKSDMPLKLVDGQFEGGQDGGDAYVATRKNADELLKKRVHKWEDWGLWTLGGAWALAVVIAPFEWYYNVFTNRRMKDESLKYSEIIFFNSTFYPGEKMDRCILFPIMKPFYLRLVFRDENTGEIYTITKESADKSY